MKSCALTKIIWCTLKIDIYLYDDKLLVMSRVTLPDNAIYLFGGDAKWSAYHCHPL